MQIAHCLAQHDPGGLGLGAQHLGQPPRAGRYTGGKSKGGEIGLKRDPNMPARSAGNSCGLASATLMKASGTSINESE
eukprot:3637851-Prymnesium_polylepis.1